MFGVALHGVLRTPAGLRLGSVLPVVEPLLHVRHALEGELTAEGVLERELHADQECRTYLETRLGISSIYQNIFFLIIYASA